MDIGGIAQRQSNWCKEVAVKSSVFLEAAARANASHARCEHTVFGCTLRIQLGQSDSVTNMRDRGGSMQIETRSGWSDDDAGYNQQICTICKFRETHYDT